jgi:hypothetical protein
MPRTWASRKANALTQGTSLPADPNTLYPVVDPTSGRVEGIMLAEHLLWAARWNRDHAHALSRKSREDRACAGDNRSAQRLQDVLSGS